MGKTNKTNNYTEFFYKAFRNILLISIPLATISALILSLPHSSANTDQIEFSLSVSCTMSSVVNSAHTKEITNGTYHSDVGKTTITALCNDGNGYTVYATGYGNNEEGNNKLINSSYPQYSIDTGLATSGLTSTWAMKLNNLENDPSSTPPVIESAYDDTYGLVPNNWTKVASRQSGTTDMNLGSSFTTTYSIYTSSSQFAGTYRGQVKYALLHPYKNDNVMSLEDSFALHGKEKVAVTDPIAEQTGGYYKMQDMESEICNSANAYGEASAAQLVDIRDNNLYWVAKLNDGKCWMTQNLDLDLVSNEQDSTTMKALTSNDTDLIDGSLAGAYSNGYAYDANTGIITWTPAKSAETTSFTGTTVSEWQNSNTVPYSANKTDSTETGHASLGNYYNWTAAIASNNSVSLAGNTLSDITNNPRNSICPMGWRLPTMSDQSGAISGSTNEFARLNYLYNNNSQTSDANLLISPIWLVKSGFIGGENIQLNNCGSRGNYLSSSMTDDSRYIGNFGFESNKVLGEWRSYLSRRNGFSVRCVAR